MAVIGDDSNRFSIVFHQPSQLAACFGFETNATAQVKGHHIDMGLHVFQELQPLNDTMIQGQQFVDAQMIDIDHG